VTTIVKVTRVVDLPVERAWDLVADPRNHARWVPLTRVAVDGLPLGVGTRVTALSGPLIQQGVPGLPDRMRIDVFRPPAGCHGGEAVFTKTGPVLLGRAAISTSPTDDGRTAVTWLEDVHLAGPLPRALTAALLAPVLRAMLHYALRQVAREVRAGAA
jgi:Polyketide cyclase / dehydrase and lipid transport